MSCNRETERCQGWLDAAHSGDVSTIDRPECCTKALEELAIRCHEVLTKAGIYWFTDFGTMLGLYRDGKIIDHDTDIDVTIKLSDFDKMVALKEDFEKDGFYLEVDPEDYKGIVRLHYSYKNRIHVDIWTYKDVEAQQGTYMVYEHPYLAGGHNGGHNNDILCNQLDNIGYIEAYGKQWPMIADTVSALQRRYGKHDWEVPNNHAQGCKKGW